MVLGGVAQQEGIAIGKHLLGETDQKILSSIGEGVLPSGGGRGKKEP